MKTAPDSSPWFLPFFGFLALIFSASSVHAACGDDIDGARIPCACGDVVASDTRLRGDDPVVRERCPNDGLIVRAGSDAESIVLDMAGLSIAGLGSGVGIYVIDGGSAGAIIVGGTADRPGTVAGFGTGLRARGQRSVAEISYLLLTGNDGDGLALRGAGTKLVGVVAERNGRDGLRLGGRGAELEGVEARGNGRYGLRVTGQGTSGDASTSDNGAAPVINPRAMGQLAIEGGE